MFSPAVYALAKEGLVSANVLPSMDVSSVPELTLTQNSHPPVDAGQPGGGTTGAGTR
ncbi:MAG: hypothetical protein ACTS2F_16210 [Thainema sp.]